MEPTPPSQAEVGCELTFAIAEHATIALHIAVAATAGIIESESIEVTLDGAAVPAVEVGVDFGGRVHTVDCGSGLLAVSYRGVVTPAAPSDAVPSAAERLIALRQSRYCQSDALEAFAAAEFQALPPDASRARAIGGWVFERTRYELGSSGPLETAVDTLLSGRGVCRDFAHLTVALCRASGIPARMASVYAPGLSPMDFHAVAEVASEDGWEIIDASRLAPRASLVRIATGRDAADTSFAHTLAGSAELLTAYVFASTRGDLPVDDHSGPVAIA